MTLSKGYFSFFGGVRLALGLLAMSGLLAMGLIEGIALSDARRGMGPHGAYTHLATIKGGTTQAWLSATEATLHSTATIVWWTGIILFTLVQVSTNEGWISQRTD